MQYTIYRYCGNLLCEQKNLSLVVIRMWEIILILRLIKIYYPGLEKLDLRLWDYDVEIHRLVSMRNWAYR